MDFMLPKITEFICYLKSRNSYVTQNHGIHMLLKVTEYICYLVTEFMLPKITEFI